MAGRNALEWISPEAFQACQAANLWLMRVEHSSCVGTQLVQPAAMIAYIQVKLQALTALHQTDLHEPHLQLLHYWCLGECV